jgi:hypothetical protein
MVGVWDEAEGFEGSRGKKMGEFIDYPRLTVNQD